MHPQLYKLVIRPLLFRMDAEDAHNAVHRLLKSYGPLLQFTAPDSPINLRRQFRGTHLRNPIGLAAGFDKNADLVHVLGHLGFGFAEVGSITAQARSGNEKPRLFRLPDDNAIINRMGLNGQGAEGVCKKLSSARFSLPIGVNIAKTNDPAIVGDTAIEDILTSFRYARSLPIMYITVNASCPNAKGGVVSEVQMLSTMMDELSKENQSGVPIFLKLSSDSTPAFIEEVVDAARRYRLHGFVCSNTTTSREQLLTATNTVTAIGAGGLSGQPLKKRALTLCALTNSLKGPDQIIIGCGGISSGQDAFDFIMAGASFVQLYTAMVYQGPGVVAKIANELSTLLAREHISIPGEAKPLIQQHSAN
jgi:dihydroorotate dehydrogenase